MRGMRIIWAVVVLIIAAELGNALEKKVLTEVEIEKRLEDNWKAVNEYMGKEKIKTITSEQDFNKYIVRSPRNYTIFILYTAQANCDICLQISSEYERVVDHFRSLYPPPHFSPSSSPYSSSATFFFRIYIHQLYDLSLKMGIPAIPAIFHAPMTNKIGFPHKPTQYLHFQGHESDFSAFEIAKFFSSKTSLPVEGIRKPISMKVVYISLGICVFLFPLLFLLILHPRSRWTYFYLSLLIYMGMMAGLIGNEVHGTPWFQSNIWTGQQSYFYPSIQRQYRLEGLIASFIIVGGSASLIYLTQGVNYIKGAIKKRVAFIATLSLFLLALSHWLEIFSFKYPAYPFLYFYPIPYRHYFSLLSLYLPPFLSNLLF